MEVGPGQGSEPVLPIRRLTGRQAIVAVLVSRDQRKEVLFLLGLQFLLRRRPRKPLGMVRVEVLHGVAGGGEQAEEDAAAAAQTFQGDRVEALHELHEDGIGKAAQEALGAVVFRRRYQRVHRRRVGLSREVLIPKMGDEGPLVLVLVLVRRGLAGVAAICRWRRLRVLVRQHASSSDFVAAQAACRWASIQAGEVAGVFSKKQINI